MQVHVAVSLKILSANSLVLTTYIFIVYSTNLNRPYILNQVSAQDKASGKTQKITITSDKGRLGEEEIARMVAEAEENAEADKLIRGRVEAKNQLEGYLYSLRSTVDDTLKDKLDAESKEKLSSTVTEGLAWLDEHQSDEKEVFDEKRKEIEVVANPIISKAYGTGNVPSGASAGTSGPESPSAGGSDTSSGPTVEEVD